MAQKIRVKHITNSLYQLEKWCQYLRYSMANMDPNLMVSGDDDVAPPHGPVLAKPPVLAMGCPPPRRDDDDCDDDKDNGKGKGKGKGRKKKAVPK